MSRWILPVAAALAVAAAVSSPARPASTQRTLRLRTRTGTCWLPAGGPWRAWLGRGGVSERHREDDGTTPAGVFGFERTIYGVAGNFLHASIGRPTAGCVSVPVSRLVAILRWLRPSSRARIAIGTRAEIANF
jgi:L,D-peptidoglycan transpeptidase YkuD (ErfK/YbiS/YcfS/YnhG family)